jgi:hypothetical protein
MTLQRKRKAREWWLDPESERVAHMIDGECDDHGVCSEGGRYIRVREVLRPKAKARKGKKR